MCGYSTTRHVIILKVNVQRPKAFVLRNTVLHVLACWCAFACSAHTGAL